MVLWLTMVKYFGRGRYHCLMNAYNGSHSTFRPPIVALQHLGTSRQQIGFRGMLSRRKTRWE